MSFEETTKRLLTSENYDVAIEAVRLLREMPGVRPTEIQERMERVAWLTSVDMDLLKYEELGLSKEEFNHVVLGVRFTQRPDWRPIEGYVWGLAGVWEEHRLVAACTHFGKLKWARVHDRKKARRKLWGESKHWVMDLVRLLGEPYGSWLLKQFEQELTA